MIEGGDACVKTPKTCDLSKGVEVNGDQITFHLSKGDPEFLQQLALPFAFILPGRHAGQARRHPAARHRAVQVVRVQATSAMSVVRNPFFKEWSKDAQPAGLPDVIEQKFGLSVQAEVTQVENGQADWISNPPIPADRLPELARKYPSSCTSARCATEHGAEHQRAAVRQREGAPGGQLRDRPQRDREDLRRPAARTPTCQILPPNLPGYQPYCPFTANPGSGKWTAPDMAKAQQLVKESGTRDARQGQQRHDRRAQGGRRVLRRGCSTSSATRRRRSSSRHDIQYPYVQNSKNKVQIGWSDWFADYPAASDFLEILLGCDSFHPNSNSSPNIAQFCDKTIQGQMDKASSTALEDPNAANQQWAAVDKATTDKAPWVSLVNTKMLDFTSARVKGFQFSPQWYFLLAQASVK